MPEVRANPHLINHLMNDCHVSPPQLQSGDDLRRLSESRQASSTLFSIEPAVRLPARLPTFALDAVVGRMCLLE